VTVPEISGITISLGLLRTNSSNLIPQAVGLDFFGVDERQEMRDNAWRVCEMRTKKALGTLA